MLKNRTTVLDVLRKMIDSDKAEVLMDTTKARISSRISKPPRKTLEEAAALSGATLNQFVVQAVLKETRVVRERFIHLSRRDADVYFKALTNPPSPFVPECSGLSA